MDYPPNMDKECIALCDAINLKDGIHSIESCCGHGKGPFQIWFVADNLESLPDILYWFDGCHSGHYNWQVTATTDCGKSPVKFMIEGPVGAYDEANDIADMIRKDYENKWRG